jgi:cellulose synthase/poly-beta-1,6-N-acetylglucosamine synthase-like glycosyltransferase
LVIPLISIIILCFTLLYIGMLLYLRKGWMSISYVKAQDKNFKTRVSILIAARNEEGKVGKAILDILAQDYPSELFELIIVDDHSDDRTVEIVSSYSDRGVKLIRLQESEKLNSYKKKAITEAIQLADGELIITTDADCRMEREWLRTIVSFYEEGNFKLVSSPVIYFEEKNVFEKVQTLEFLFLIGMSGAVIGNGKAVSCNGANLAYRRDVFFELNGFSGIDDLASGDDELFLHKVASAYPGGIGFCKSMDAAVYTYAKETIPEFLQQRKRWASKSTRYKNKGFVLLTIAIWLFNLMIIGSFIAGFYEPVFWLLSLTSLTVKIISEFIFLYPVSSFARRSSLLVYLPVLSIIHIFYLLFIGIAGNSGKYLWKGRRVR